MSGLKFTPFYLIIIIEGHNKGGTAVKTVRGNTLRGTYNRFQARQVKGIAREIPSYRKEALREEIVALANTFGVANPAAYRAAMRAL